jgi:hypothetical protein
MFFFADIGLKFPYILLKIVATSGCMLGVNSALLNWFEIIGSLECVCPKKKKRTRTTFVFYGRILLFHDDFEFSQASRPEKKDRV